MTSICGYRGVGSSGDPMASLRYAPLRAAAVNGSLVITFADPVVMSGWWFETGDGPPDHDPVRFRLERSLDPDPTGAWDQVG